MFETKYLGESLNTDLDTSYINANIYLDIYVWSPDSIHAIYFVTEKKVYFPLTFSAIVLFFLWKVLKNDLNC